MAVRQQIPPLDVLAAMAQGALTARRPEAVRHVESGWYGAVLVGWRGQAATVRGRLGAEILAARLPLAEGEDLAQLAESEYWATLDDEPRKAAGEATIQRQVENSHGTGSGNFTPGTFPAGTQFRRQAAPAAQPPREDATYGTRSPVYAGANDTEPVEDLGGGQYRHTQRLVLTVDAERDGPHANTPEFSDLSGEELAGVIVSDLWDPSWECLDLRAAGGQLAPGDDQIRAYAFSSHRGRLGPIDAAILAGSYSHGGIWRAVLVDDTTRGIGVLYLADKSWAYSQALLADVGQVLLGQGPEASGGARRWLGFGARVETRPVVNRLVRVQAAVQLRSPDYAEETTAVSDAIRESLVDYFDNRADWFTWRTAGLGASICSADRRILACSSVSLLDRDGDPLQQPDSSIDPDSAASLTHYYLEDKSLQVDYSIPG